MKHVTFVVCYDVTRMTQFMLFVICRTGPLQPDRALTSMLLLEPPGGDLLLPLDRDPL